jgi:hypothetical protein
MVRPVSCFVILDDFAVNIRLAVLKPNGGVQCCIDGDVSEQKGSVSIFPGLLDQNSCRENGKFATRSLDLSPAAT